MNNKVLKIGITSILLVSIVLFNVFMMPVKANEAETMDENYEDLANQYQPVFN